MGNAASGCKTLAIRGQRLFTNKCQRDPPTRKPRSKMILTTCAACEPPGPLPTQTAATTTRSLPDRPCQQPRRCVHAAFSYCDVQHYCCGRQYNADTEYVETLPSAALAPHHHAQRSRAQVPPAHGSPRQRRGCHGCDHPRDQPKNTVPAPASRRFFAPKNGKTVNMGTVPSFPSGASAHLACKGTTAGYRNCLRSLGSKSEPQTTSACVQHLVARVASDHGRSRDGDDSLHRPRKETFTFYGKLHGNHATPVNPGCAGYGCRDAEFGLGQGAARGEGQPASRGVARNWVARGVAGSSSQNGLCQWVTRDGRRSGQALKGARIPRRSLKTPQLAELIPKVRKRTHELRPLVGRRHRRRSNRRVRQLAEHEGQRHADAHS